ncbi:MAG: heparan-alpha-glucosaminide N-acetyltransferase domain-containing protein [Bacteroidota bacterium]|nr:heparan-alpha-glucosaminide N-acetyltransferase domain-containing protein [Bacteroidota bacterium]
MVSQTTIEKLRYLFIDLYRGLVILMMLQGHTFRALLDNKIMESAAFQFHDFFHGVSAPAFLFGSGLTFVLSTRKRWEDYHHWDPPFARRLGRILLILILGYILHLPFMSSRKLILEASTTDYLQFFQSDVLQCIGFGLLALHGLLFFFKTERRFYGLVLAATIAIPLLTPLFWDIDFLKHYSPFIAQLLNSKNGSIFPLFPFVGFLFTGVIVSWEFMLAVEHKREKSFMRRFFFLGPAFILVGLLLDAVPFQLYPTYNFWYTSPSYFAIRVGALLLIIGIIWFIVEKIKQPPRWITILGKESLLIYVLHLVLLYGSVVNPRFSITYFLGSDLNILQTSIIFVVFSSIMVGIAFGWDYLKREKYNTYRIIQLTTAAVFFTIFFTLEY